MSEWSEYFEDFPEEDPANYIGGTFDPAAAKSQRETNEKIEQRLRKEQSALDAEIARIKKKHQAP